MLICYFCTSSSYGRQLSEKCRWAGSEFNVRTHFTEPPCFIWYRILLLQYQLWVNYVKFFIVFDSKTHTFATKIINIIFYAYPYRLNYIFKWNLPTPGFPLVSSHTGIIYYVIQVVMFLTSTILVWLLRNHIWY